MPEIRFPSFAFDHPLVETIIELERERDALRSGSTPAWLLFELHDLFQVLTSILSARIEGNRTSLVDALQASKEAGGGARDDGAQEILNILSAIDFIDAHAPNEPLSHTVVRELHRVVTDGLVREGDQTPGAYRRGFVTISRSQHRPPAPHDVLDHMSQVIDFANESVSPHKQLLQVALAHHAFLWVHPFGNGNGRVARLLSYWMLVRLGFSRPGTPRTVNPTAVFGADRDGYYDALEAADGMTDAVLIGWCSFVLQGIRDDLARMARLTDGAWVSGSLLVPAIERMRSAGLLNDRDAAALRIAAAETTVQAADLAPAFQGTPSARSNAIRSLIDRGLLVPVAVGKRRYRLGFARTGLTPFVIATLDDAGMLPKLLTEP